MVAVVKGRPTDDEPMRQNEWYTDAAADKYVHEIVHGLGVRDGRDGADPRVLLTPGGHRPQDVPDGHYDLMDPYQDGKKALLTPDHLRQIADVLTPYLHQNTVGATSAQGVVVTASDAVAASRSENAPDVAGVEEQSGRRGPDVAPAMRDARGAGEPGEGVPARTAGESDLDEWFAQEGAVAGLLDDLSDSGRPGDTAGAGDKAIDVAPTVDYTTAHGDDFDVLGSDEFSGRLQESSGTDGEPAGPVAPQAPAAGVSTVAGTAADGHSPATLLQAEVRYAQGRLGSFEAVADILRVGTPRVEGWASSRTSRLEVVHAERLRALVDLLQEPGRTGPPSKEEVDARVSSNWSLLQSKMVRLLKRLGSFEAVAEVLGVTVVAVSHYRSGETRNPAKAMVERIDAALALLAEPGRTGPVTADDVTARVTPYDARRKLDDLEEWLGSKSAVARELGVAPRSISKVKKNNNPRADFAARIDALHSKYQQLGLADGETVSQASVRYLVDRLGSDEAVARILKLEDGADLVRVYLRGVPPGRGVAERINAAVALLQEPGRTGPPSKEEVDARVSSSWCALQSKTAHLLKRLGSFEAVADILRIKVRAVRLYRFGDITNLSPAVADRYDAALALLEERGPGGTVAKEEVDARVTPYDARGKLDFLAKWLGSPTAVARELGLDEDVVRKLMSGAAPSMLDRDRIDAACESVRERLRALGVDFGDSAEQPVQRTGNELDFFGDAQPMDGTQLEGEQWLITEDDADFLMGDFQNPFTGDEALFLSEQWLQTSSHESVSTTGEEHVQPGTTQPATSRAATGRAAESPEGQPPAKQRRLNDESGADESHLDEWFAQEGAVADLLDDLSDSGRPGDTAGAGDMAIDVAPAVDYTMVHGDDSGLPASRAGERADEAGGELLASGEVSTDRWIP
ncbi:hypothetical protein PV408_46385, partial [Streptomyces sp. ME18-1-4]|nr:hypothetical protein [Streptomyces sp. ME18-1-4]